MFVLTCLSTKRTNRGPAHGEVTWEVVLQGALARLGGVVLVSFVTFALVAALAVALVGRRAASGVNEVGTRTAGGTLLHT